MALLRFLFLGIFLVLLLWLKSFWIIAIGFAILFLFNESTINLDRIIKKNEILLLKDIENVINYLDKWCPSCQKENMHVGKNRPNRLNEGNYKDCQAS